MGILNNRLGRWRRQRLRALGVEGAARFAAAAGALLLAAVLADRWLMLAQPARWGLFWAACAAAAWGLYSQFLRPLSLLKPERIFRVVAEARPELSSHLLSAWELATRGAPVQTSRDLAEAHVARTEALLEKLPDDGIFPRRPSPAAARRLTWVAAAWGLALPWAAGHQASFQRVMAPWRDAGLDALVEVRPGDAASVWGEAVEISARWRGAEKGPLELYLRSSGGRFTRASWDADGRRYRVEGLTETLEYRIGFKDLRTRSYALRPLPYAQLKNISLRLRLPGQAEEQTLQVSGGAEIAALRGSWVTVRGTPDRGILRAEMKVSYLSAPVPMKELPGGDWEGGFPLNEDGGMQFFLTSEDELSDPRPVVHALRALADAAPKVDLLSPAFELEISPKERLTLTYEAEDDYGLSALSLLVRSGDKESVIPLETFKKAPLEHLGEYSWDLSAFPTGAKIEFRIRASDNGRPAGTSVSNAGVLRLADFETSHAAAEARWKEASEGLNQLAAEESKLKEFYGELSKEAATEPQTSAAEQAARSAAAEQAAAQNWQKAVSELSKFSQAMTQDAYANPGMTRAAEMLTEALDGLSKRELAQAAQAAAQRDFPAAAKAHERLENNARKAAEILSAGKEMQSMQDFWSEAHRMDQAGSEIAKSLGDIAKSGRAPSAQEAAKLQQAMSKLKEQMADMAKAIDELPKADADSQTAGNRKVYQVPLNAASRTADALEEAMARGDYKAAAQLAEQLSRQLAQVREAVAKAARSQASQEGDEAAERLERATKMWKDVVDQQAKAMEMTQKVEESALERKTKGQKNLLAELAGLQKEAIAKAGSAASAQNMQAMRGVLAEFENSRIEFAPQWLGALQNTLRVQAAMSYPAVDGVQPPEAAGLIAAAGLEADILKRLEEGAEPSAMEAGELEEMMGASAVQRQTTRKTESLQGELDSVAKARGGVVPADIGSALESAQGEQRQAEQAFARQDGIGARGHQQKALEHLERGKDALQKAMQQQQQMMQGQTSPFGKPRGVARPSGPGGRTGADTGFVPLPGAQEYQPPREIRTEIERSLRERRPAAYDGTVNDYLKRMSQ